MLSELSIENFAIIDRLQLRFEDGFTVLTGETGAGKSIIIDALQAVLGARVGNDAVRAGSPLASIEALFSPGKGDRATLLDLVQQYGIELDECLILRREISANGRGSARINGRAIPLSVLSAVGNMLVDIHGQSDHLSILRSDRQLDVLDRYGDLLPLRSTMSTSVLEYHALRDQLEALTTGQREAQQRLDLLRFQVQEIETAGFHPDEDQELAEERNLLANAERLATLAGSVYEALQGSAGSALERVYGATSAGKEVAAIDSALLPISERLDACHYELEDLAQEMRRYRDQIEFDPRRLDAVEERLDLLTRFSRKYGPDLADILEYAERAKGDLEDIENYEDRLAAFRSQVSSAAERAGKMAGDLSQQRDRIAAELSENVQQALLGLGLEGTQFKAQIEQHRDDLGLSIQGRDGTFRVGTTGVDHIVFLVSFNPGEPLRPLDKVASGGETSRFLLALKSVLAEADGTPTLIFDEVDVGVGARAGTVVGERMRSLSANHQVLSITHLPQVAALAQHHATVTKTVTDGKAGVAVQMIEADERVNEIAGMMSGMVTQASLKSAEELLAAAQRQS